MITIQLYNKPLHEFPVSIDTRDLYLDQDPVVIYTIREEIMYPLAIVHFVNLVLNDVGWEAIMLHDRQHSPTFTEQASVVGYIITQLRKIALENKDYRNFRFVYGDRIYQ